VLALGDQQQRARGQVLGDVGCAPRTSLKRRHALLDPMVVDLGDSLGVVTPGVPHGRVGMRRVTQTPSTAQTVARWNAILFRMEPGSSLIVTADDYGYRTSYDEGILEAARAGAVDAVSAMVMRAGCRPEPLLETGVEIGLHLELPGHVPGGARGGGDAAATALRMQLRRFEDLFGRPAAYLDGHHHCHARASAAEAVAGVAAERSLAVRSIDAAHRRLLRSVGVATPDRLLGRLTEREAALPGDLRPAVDGGELPAGVSEWMVHPGRRDPGSRSDYDLGREEDLDLLLGLALQQALAGARRSHRAALG
jgi:predicted glycoside hydrolase/deacetylase ChbG (UPF0249 family)